MKASGGVPDGDELRGASLPVDLDATEARKQERRAAVNDSAPIKLGDDLHRKRQLSPPRLHGDRLRHGVDKISAKADESLHRPAENAATGLHRVETLHAWRLKRILRRQPVERGKLGLLGDADSAAPAHSSGHAQEKCRRRLSRYCR